jgi:hypothetical protein
VQVLGDHDLEERDDRVASAEARFAGTFADLADPDVMSQAWT